MLKKHIRFHIGMRTVKTAIAVFVAMVLAEFFGASNSRLIFAMLGAMAAMQPTFKESWESCLTQVIGVFFGAITGVLFRLLPVPDLLSAGLGIILVITLYNALRICFSPTLPCMIMVMLCMTQDLHPVTYAISRIWDSAIGLGVGMAVNILIFPYDNSRRIHSTAESLDRELIVFLEELFDGDSQMPDADKMSQKIEYFDEQLKIFAKQKLLFRKRSKSRQLEHFRIYEGKARELVARMEVLSRMEKPGRLNEENRQALIACGANVQEGYLAADPTELDVVTNYHIRQILKLRNQLLEVLREVKA